MRIHRDANMSIHKTTHMRIHNDANMSFHKDRQSPPIIEATRAGRYRYPGSHRVRHQCPYRHPQWARCAQPASHLRPRVRPRAARARAAAANATMPPRGPTRCPLRLPDFPGAATTAQPRNPEPLAGNHNQCAQLSAVIIKANTNADNPTTRAVMFHLGTYIPARGARHLRVQRDRHLAVHRRHGRVDVPQRYQRTRQRGETPLERQRSRAHRQHRRLSEPTAQRAANARQEHGTPRAVCSPAIRRDLPRSTRELSVRALPAGALDGHVGGRHGRGADARAGDRHRRVEHLRAGAGRRRRPGPRLADGDRRRDQLRHRGPRRRDRRPDPGAPEPTARRWTPCRGCARRRPKTSTSPPSPNHNGADDIVRIEPQRLGAGSAPGPTAPDLLDLSRPTPGFVELAEDIGVAARRVHTADELAHARRGAVIEPGPHLN